MKPNLLQRGDEIRVVAPSTGIKIIGDDCRQIAKERFEAMGLKVTFGKNTVDENFDEFRTSGYEKRAEDIMDAFRDKNVKAIFTIIGGFNSNQVLPFLDYDLIRANPKIVCGFSDITALLNGIRAKTGLVVFYGPHYSSIGMKKGNEYTLENMQKMLFAGSDEFLPSGEWSDDLWFLDQEKREFIKNDGWWIMQDGNAQGILEGGNLSTLVLLGGTDFAVKFTQPTILAIENCFISKADKAEFLRQLQALAQRADFAQVKAVLIGRLQKESAVSRGDLEYIVRAIPQLKRLPIIANMDFGHTTPIATLPLGGRCTIKDGKIKLDW